MIDLHSHILPGVDDGVATLAEARELARAALADGATAIAATPHVREDFPTSPGTMEEGVAALRQDFGEQGIELDVLTGGELSLGLLPTLDRDELMRFSLAGSERYVLRRVSLQGVAARARDRAPPPRRRAASRPCSPIPSATRPCRRSRSGSSA